MTRIREVNGPRGGEFFVVDLSDGRVVSVSRKAGDERVWVGRLGDPGSFHGQRGGVGTVQKLLDEWRSRVALDPRMAEMYAALSQLAAAKKASS